METVNLQTKLSADIKKKADMVFEHWGTTTQEAVRIFLARSIQVGGFPFDLSVEEMPTQETFAAMNEAEKIAMNRDKEYYTMTHFSDFLKELND
jgi:addiction module RelB/DinJ family antitoxin